MTAFSELVLNFHMTEACNYRCGFCYATWEGHAVWRQLDLPVATTKIAARQAAAASAAAPFFLGAPAAWARKLSTAMRSSTTL